MALAPLTLAAILASAGPAPMVDPPTSYGPYAIGYTYDTIRPSTNGNNTYLKTYYPAVAAVSCAMARIPANVRLPPTVPPLASIVHAVPNAPIEGLRSRSPW